MTEGFPIKRTAEDTLKIYQTLVDGDGEVPRAAGDFDTRKGLTQKPLTTSDQTSITLTHSYINVTTLFGFLSYCIVATSTTNTGYRNLVHLVTQVDLVKFKSLCLEASSNICDNFSWTRINHTLHGPLHHGVELITRNDGYGLGSLSEECLEANNKDIRNYLQFLSRKVSPEAQVTDVMNRLLERSDPGILHLSMASQRKKYCTECGSTDHTIRSHSRLTSLPKKWYTSLVEDIFLD